MPLSFRCCKRAISLSCCLLCASFSFAKTDFWCSFFDLDFVLKVGFAVVLDFIFSVGFADDNFGFDDDFDAGFGFGFGFDDD